MENLNKAIENHYLKEDLFEDIIGRLEEQGVDLDKVQRVHISDVDEFHVRGAIVSKELASSINMKGLHVLDVGCGLGGPCRMLADEYDCISTGIDLSNEYIRTATKLSKLVKLDDKTSFIKGDAVNLPFEDNTFDVVWTQHVQMNIPDKNKFYSEIKRVLKKNGHLLYYDIFKKGDIEVTYPMPWASNSSQSFLFSLENKNQILSNLGFSKVQTENQTKKGVDFFETLVAKLKEVGPPKMGLNVLMGETTKQKLVNLMNHLKEEKLVLQSGTYKY
ncbi:class I SAM-dependent methyltransferase [Flavobacteriaceae bacterium S0825]|uniref:class I SAM-dependent methyltransferase n=1 Tax=Gaetbulibacter sp. S0825 TaxID=2720084 RepID=UPI0014314D6B|nr:class I SAM-dependent methyltransferase [Gaetbulibacter sp. S0825]MCK0109824.1 class I SAM-dependent methyltransferase [Flavobacteriaceae bacterium S0825]NIX65453.1 class I SAM-dependent methyltransferase [Gaetbulibacter sp. S0825]